jgi:hypothetical protein
MPVLKQLALKIGPLRRLYEDRNRLASKLAQGRDLENGLGQNRFYHYTAAFDAIGTMRQLRRGEPEADARLSHQLAGCSH